MKILTLPLHEWIILIFSNTEKIYNTSSHLINNEISSLKNKTNSPAIAINCVVVLIYASRNRIYKLNFFITISVSFYVLPFNRIRSLRNKC